MEMNGETFTADTKNIQNIIKECLENQHSIKLENLKETWILGT